MILDDIAKVSQGAILSRIQTLSSADSLAVSIYSMKEMNESLGIYYRGSTEKLQEIHVTRSKMTQLPLSQEGMVLINLTAHRAVAVLPEHVGKLVTSNFAIVIPNSKLDPLYLEWYFNEHPQCLRQLRIFTQGSSVSALSIQMLRSLDLILPSIQEQATMGKINHALYKKKRLLTEQLLLEEQMINQRLLQYLREEHQQ